MKVNGKTRTCGLIGNPVEHTMSPAIHNTLADKMGLNLVYVPFHVPTGHVEDAVKGAYALNLLGCNVTVPYKSEVIPYLQEVDSLAAQIGAVNNAGKCYSMSFKHYFISYIFLRVTPIRIFIVSYFSLANFLDF